MQYVKPLEAMFSSSIILRSKKEIFIFFMPYDALDAFNSVLQDFGFSQKLEQYDPKNILHSQFQQTPSTLGNKQNIPLNHDFATPSADLS